MTRLDDYLQQTTSGYQENRGTTLDKYIGSSGIKLDEARQRIRERDESLRRERMARPVEPPAPEKRSIFSRAKEFGVGLAKETGKALVRSAGISADIGERFFTPIGKARETYGAYKTAFRRGEDESFSEALQRGLIQEKARPLWYEKAVGATEGKPDYELPALEGGVVSRAGQLVTDPEYRRGLASAVEAPTYAFGMGAKALTGVGKGLAARIATRTVQSQPEALINTAVQLAGEEDPTVKKGLQYWLANTLLMSGISNLSGEIKYKKGNKALDAQVDKTVDEITEKTGRRFSDTDKNSLADAFEQGAVKEEVVEIADKVTSRQPTKIKVGDLAPKIDEIKAKTGDLKISQIDDARTKLEQGWEVDEIVEDIRRPEPVKVEKPKVEKVEKPKEEIKPPSEKIDTKGRAITKEDYLKEKGASPLVGDVAIQKNMTDLQKKRAMKQLRIDQADSKVLRAKLSKEYAVKIKSGELRIPTRTEELVRTAQGHPDNEAVQAARRLLKKRGIDYKTKDITIKPAVKPIKKPKPTPPKKKAKKVEPKKSVTAQKLNKVLPPEAKISEDYDVIQLKNELNKASKEIAKDKDKALKDAYDKKKPTTGRIAKLTEFAETAKRDKDYNSVNSIFTEIRKTATETAQGMNMLKGLYAGNPEYKFMSDVVNARLRKIVVGKKDIKKAIKEANKVVENTVNKIKDTTKRAYKVKDAQEMLNKIMCK